MLSFLLLNGAAVIVAVAIARAAVGVTPRSHFVLAAAATYLVVIHTTVLAAGLAGALTVRTMLGVWLVVLVVVTWRVGAARRPDTASAEPESEARAGSLARAAAVLATGALVIVLAPHVTDATRVWIWDDYTYHMVYPALWLQQHAIAAPVPAHAFTMQAWYPLSASVVSVWFMLPFAPERGDMLAWVSLTAVLYAVLVAAAMAEALRRLGAPPGAWALPLALFATSTRVGVMASTFSDADLAQAAALLAAFVFALPCGDRERAGDVRVDACYAALLSGLALGIKVAAGPAACVVLLMILLRARAVAPRLATVMPVVAMFGAAWLATGGYWYVRNVYHTGNPLYPARFLGWDGTAFPHTTLGEYAAHYGLARAVQDALAVYLDWPRLHALLALVAIAGVGVWRLVRRSGRSRATAYFSGGVVGITAITLVALPSMPYSAGNGMTFAAGLIHWDSMRYVALLPLLGWTALGAVLGRVPRLPPSVAAIVIMAAATWAAAVSMLAWLTATVAVAMVAVVWSFWQRLAPRGGMLVGGLAAVAFVAWAHGGKAGATAAAIYQEPLFGRAALAIAQHPPGTRIAIYGDQWTYPAFGDRHHLAPVRLDGDGRVARTPVGDAMTPGPLTVDAAAFRANLRASGIGLVAVVHLPHPGRSPEWPAQAAVLDRMEGVRSIYRDAAVGLWRVEDP